MDSLATYFKIIRKARSLNRIKGCEYFEAHHIVPKSFGKLSRTVLLTPKEHFICHKLLANAFNQHPIYSKKMNWALHMLAYSGSHKLSSADYASIRKDLIDTLWSLPKTAEHKKKLSESKMGNKNPNFGKPGINLGKQMSSETKQKLSISTSARLHGKTGEHAMASKGSVSVEFESGTIMSANSMPELSKITKIPTSTIWYRINHYPNIMKNGYAVYAS